MSVQPILFEPDRAVISSSPQLWDCAVSASGTLRLALHEGLAPGWWPNRFSRYWRWRRSSQHPRFKFFREAGEEGSINLFLSRRTWLIDRDAFCRGVLVVQTIESRAFLADEILDAHQRKVSLHELAPVVSEARMLDRLRCSWWCRNASQALARNMWWSWDHDCVSLFRAISGSGGLPSEQQQSYFASDGPCRCRKLSAAPPRS